MQFLSDFPFQKKEPMTLGKTLSGHEHKHSRYLTDWFEVLQAARTEWENYIINDDPFPRDKVKLALKVHSGFCEALFQTEIFTIAWGKKPHNKGDL